MCNLFAFFLKKTKKQLFVFWFYYLLTLLAIYPLSPYLFNKYLKIREPKFISPIVCAEIKIRSDSYGDGAFNARRGGGRRKHNGLDIRAGMGETVVASKSGIAKTGWVKGGMGKYVKIIHKDGYSTLYGHLSGIIAKNNHWVWQGEPIGEAGKTGNANYKRMQTHVHFEIKLNDEYQDPYKLLMNNNKTSRN